MRVGLRLLFLCAPIALCLVNPIPLNDYVRQYIAASPQESGTIFAGKQSSTGKLEYSSNRFYEWLIEAPSGHTVTLTFSKLETECSFDYIFVYDGRPSSHRLLASLSGNSTLPTLLAASGWMSIHFFTDANTARAGFRATYQVNPCPNNCSNLEDARCVANENGSHQCICPLTRRGSDCSILRGPEGCGSYSSYGKMIISTNTSVLSWCFCATGYAGESCSMDMEKSRKYHAWFLLSKGTELPGAVGRAAVAVTDQKNADQKYTYIYSFGGFNLNEMTDDFFKYDLIDSTWNRIEKSDSTWPPARAFHTMTVYASKIYLFGGVLTLQYDRNDERMDSRLWVYDSEKGWKSYPLPETIQPLADHTANIVDNKIYMIGGRLADDSFNQYVYTLEADSLQWARLNPVGLTGLSLRLVGHSTVHDRTRNTLVIFGGYRPINPSFSGKSSSMFGYDVKLNYLAEWHPRERDPGARPGSIVQHSAAVIGNYMVVFGGSMKVQPNDESCCVMNKTFVFHLDCHMWVDKHKLLMEHREISVSTHEPAPRKGHSVVMLGDNLMGILGGYDGQVLSDLNVYKAPPSMYNTEEEDVCMSAGDSEAQCSLNPKCKFCYNWNSVKMNMCIAKISTDNCEREVAGFCPGICGSLTDCRSCNVFGGHDCGWCSATQTCLNNTEEPECPELRPSGRFAFIVSADLCREEKPPGFVWTTYYSPINDDFPDRVRLGVAPQIDLGDDLNNNRRVSDLDRYSELKTLSIKQVLTTRLSDAKQLRIPEWVAILDKVNISIGHDYTQSEGTKIAAQYNNGVPSPVPFMVDNDFCNKSRGCVLKIEIIQTTQRTRPQVSGSMVIQWTGESEDGSMRNMSKDHLHPYMISKSDQCPEMRSCLECVAHVACGWDFALGACADKSSTGAVSLIYSPHQCPVCPDLLDCQSCVATAGCAWVVNQGSNRQDVQCIRRPSKRDLDQYPDFSDMVLEKDKCSRPCHERTTCTECFQMSSVLEKRDECAWCENLGRCLPFYSYLTAYSYGICKSYADRSSHHNCETCDVQNESNDVCNDCLMRRGCGYCPNDGYGKKTCVPGNFLGPLHPASCEAPSHSSALTSLASSRLEEMVEERYNYTGCPDVNECQDANLCESQIRGSVCHNLPTTYECRCPHGHKQQLDPLNQRLFCARSCDPECLNGATCIKLDAEKYQCECRLGYFGEACERKCDCNLRSNCTRPGQCLQCIPGYTGSACEQCADGFYNSKGNCIPCQCNGHGDPARGICDKVTGQCRCRDNKAGHHCDKCDDSGYYSAPASRHCFRECEGGIAIVKDFNGTSYIGSERGNGAENKEKVDCTWQISKIDPGFARGGTTAIGGATKITFEILDINVDCNHHYVYVYEGVPSFLNGDANAADGVNALSGDSHQLDKVLGAFCGKDLHTAAEPRVRRVVESDSQITVIFKANATEKEEFFTARVTIHSPPCDGNYTPTAGVKSCVCPSNMTGYNCETPACPDHCFNSTNPPQGQCVKSDVDERMFCNCSRGFFGENCGLKQTENHRAQWTSLLKSTYSREAKYGRSGHTIVADNNQEYLYIFGGKNLANPSASDMLKYSVKENRLSAVRGEFLVIPYRGYYHAAAITDSDTIYIFGGLQVQDNKCSRQFWQFTPSEKSEGGGGGGGGGGAEGQSVNYDYHSHSENTFDWVPTMAMHTMTFIKIHPKGSRSSGNPTMGVLVIIGGYSPEHGFNNYTIQFAIHTKEWTRINTTNPGPVGLFGHSTVYYEPWKTFYVFGGYRYILNKVELSHELNALVYSQDGQTSFWSTILPKETNRNLMQPSAIAFHQAVIVADYMVVLGGRTTTEEFTNAVTFYSFPCNSWIVERRSENWRSEDERRFQGSWFVPVIGHAAVAVSNDIYIYGGFNGVTQQSMHKLSLPKDLCNIANGESRTVCNSMEGCIFCEASGSSDRCAGQPTCCLSASHYNENTLGDNCKAGTWSSTETDTCHRPVTFVSIKEYWPPRLGPTCESRQNGNECFEADFEYFSKGGAPPLRCKWCQGCGRCVNKDAPCPKDCLPDKVYENWETFYQNYQLECIQPDCGKCLASGCMWTPGLSYVDFGKQKIGMFDWGCFNQEMKSVLHQRELVFLGFSSCPAPCHTYENCSSCLSATGSEGGVSRCYWAQQLSACISPAFEQMLCAAGECGRVVRHSSEGCPKACEEQLQCAHCLAMTHCGWCSLKQGPVAEEQGYGACWEGGLSGPRQQRCTSDSVISHLLSQARPEQQANLSPAILYKLSGHVWNYGIGNCPPENECLNSHHDCHLLTQDCVDEDDPEDPTRGFKCQCKANYTMVAEDKAAGGEVCQPQCQPPCSKHGKCIAPNTCACELGYMGALCEETCDCNFHSECASPDSPEQPPCVRCVHNTTRANCDKCAIGFYGLPHTGRPDSCKSCGRACNHRTHMCIHREKTLFMGNDTNPQLLLNFYKSEQYGPETDHTDDIICIGCQNNTSGDLCDRCQVGFYMDSLTGLCNRCNCNGHALDNRCSSEDGMSCQCLGHTKTPPSCSQTSSKDSNCALFKQCSVCDSDNNYEGDPRDGRACYRLLSLINTFHIGPENEIYDEPEGSGLNRGQASFFYVWPQSDDMNPENVRIVAEIQSGVVDLYLTSDNRMVKMDQTEEFPTINLYDSLNQKIPKWRPGNLTESNILHRRLPASASGADIAAHLRSRREARKEKKRAAAVQARPPESVGSIVVMNVEQQPGRPLYVTLRHRQLMLFAPNVTGRVELVIPKVFITPPMQAKYYLVVHNRDHDGFARGIVYQVQVKVKMRLVMFIMLLFTMAICFAAFACIAYKIRVSINSANDVQQYRKEVRPIAKSTAVVKMFYNSKVEPAPEILGGKKISGAQTLPAKRSDRAPLISAGRAAYQSKIVCHQPLRKKKEAVITVLFELPACSSEHNFMFGSALIQDVKANKGPRIIPSDSTSRKEKKAPGSTLPRSQTADFPYPSHTLPNHLGGGPQAPRGVMLPGAVPLQRFQPGPVYPPHPPGSAGIPAGTLTRGGGGGYHTQTSNLSSLPRSQSNMASLSRSHSFARSPGVLLSPNSSYNV